MEHKKKARSSRGGEGQEPDNCSAVDLKATLRKHKLHKLSAQLNRSVFIMSPPTDFYVVTFKFSISLLALALLCAILVASFSAQEWIIDFSPPSLADSERERETHPQIEQRRTFLNGNESGWRNVDLAAVFWLHFVHHYLIALSSYFRMHKNFNF